MCMNSHGQPFGSVVRVLRSAVTAVACFCILAGSVSGADSASDADGYWPQWRGPHSNGVAPKGDPPVEWSESKNVRWKVDVPGVGNATPIVWGDRVYIQSAVKTDRKAEVKAEAKTEAEQPSRRGQGRRGRGRRGGNWMGGSTPTNIHQFTMFALDRRSGKTLWQTILHEAVPHEGGHRDASQASNSPVTDGEHLFAYFGSRGLYCLDMQGKVVWKKDLGRMRTVMGFGEGSSPRLYGDTIVVNFDHEGDSFIVALDKMTGEERWRVARDERTTWSTPLVIEDEGQARVVVSATNRVRAYDIKTGDVVWEAGGLGPNCIPTPIEHAGLVFVMSGYREAAGMAIRYGGAKGDISDSDRVVWRLEKGTSYVPSPVLHDGKLYILSRFNGLLSSYDMKTGAPQYAEPQRLEGLGSIYASLVAAGNRIYVLDRDGQAVVFRAGEKFEVLASNKLDDVFDASPAIAGDALYLRGHTHLYCLAEG